MLGLEQVGKILQFCGILNHAIATNIVKNAAGLQLAYKAERLLENVELQIYEKNNDIGGTWLENRYPGCVCIHVAQYFQRLNSFLSDLRHPKPQLSIYVGSKPKLVSILFIV